MYHMAWWLCNSGEGGRDNIVNNAVSAIIQVLAAAAQLHTPVTFDSILSETLCVSLSQFIVLLGTKILTHV